MVPKERINEQITANKVRLIGADGKQIGIVSLKEALHRAEAEDLDLVEISPNADPPVCRIMDFSKYYFEKEKKAKEARKRQHEVEIKEIKLGPNTEEHDYNFKKNNAIKFLKQHNKVKFTIRFRGRQMAHQELGLNVLERIKADLGHIAEPETEPVAERNMLYIIMSPKKDIDRILAKMEKEKAALEGKTVPTTQDKANSSTPDEKKKENLK